MRPAEAAAHRRTRRRKGISHAEIAEHAEAPALPKKDVAENLSALSFNFRAYIAEQNAIGF